MKTKESLPLESETYMSSSPRGIQSTVLEKAHLSPHPVEETRGSPTTYSEVTVPSPVLRKRRS